MIGHPREELLLAFQDHRLDDQRRRRLAGHLSGCQRCRNVVQAHRTVRGVFALEAPFAPDGVLERALASRAAGMLVMLPVAEPDVRRRLELPSRGFLLAVGVVLVCGVGLQVMPVAPLRSAWEAVGSFTGGRGAYGARPAFGVRYPSPPVASGATIIPSRVRPLRATYRMSRLQDGAVRSIEPLSIELTRDADAWRLQATWPNRYEIDAMLDSRLAPTSWRVISHWGSRNQHVTDARFTMLGDSIRESSQTRLAPGGTLPRFGREPYDSTWPLPSFKVEAPIALGESHMFVLFTGISLDRGWVGSFTEWFSPRYRAQMEYAPTTFRVAGSERITTPAGSFMTWRVEPLSIRRAAYSSMWIAQESGLVVMVREGRNWGTEFVLESASYP